MQYTCTKPVQFDFEPEFQQPVLVTIRDSYKLLNEQGSAHLLSVVRAAGSGLGSTNLKNRNDLQTITLSRSSANTITASVELMGSNRKSNAKETIEEVKGKSIINIDLTSL